MGLCRMTLPAWKYIHSSVAGTSHAKNGAPCQDTSACRVFTPAEGQPVFVAVASDGAGSARRAEAGSALACALFLDEMSMLFETGGAAADITREFVSGWLTRLRNEVVLRAEAEGLRPRDYACTLLAAVVGTDNAAFMQVGDGAIVIPSREEPEEYCWVFWPQQGEYANTTNFATEPEAAERLEFELVNERVNEVALLTDGLQNLALHFQTQTAHAPFFRPMFEWLRPAPEDRLEKLSASLAAFLDSTKVNDCTDDDKTLILATRREIAVIGTGNSQNDESAGS
jgi:hypothetical protein